MKKNANLAARTPVVCTKYAPALKILRIASEGYNAKANDTVLCSEGWYRVPHRAKDIFELPEEEPAIRQAVEDSIRKKIQQHEKAIAKLRATSVDQILADVKAEYLRQKGDAP